jgi:hypothetical protein
MCDKNITDFFVSPLAERKLQLFKNERDVGGGGGYRRPHNEKLHNLYASLYIIRVIKSRRMGWAGHVARMGEMRNS